jgi:hypothetical protein
MRRSSFRNFALVMSLLAAGSVAHLASGADAKVEGEARKLQGDAMDVDFLSLDLAAAKKKLQDALKKCGEDKCSKKLVASLHRDLGVVLVNNKDAKGGQSEFEAALEADENIVISKDYLDNPDVKKAWEAAKKAGASAPTTTATGKPTASATSTKPETNEGSITVKTAIAEAGYKLPIVIDIEEEAEKIKLSYKTAAMDKYKTVEAKKAGKKYLVEIGCEDTQFPGEIKFYVRAYDGEGNEVDHAGTPKKPHLIKLVDKLPEGEEGATYPDGKEPEKCTDKADCQPGFPCASANKKHQGDGCDNDDECDSGLACVPNDNGTKWCYEAGEGQGTPKKAPSKAKRMWLGADFQIDALYLSGDSNVCKASTWACVFHDPATGDHDVGLAATDAHPDNINTWDDAAGNTKAGMVVGTMRAFVSFDYFVTPNISVGARIGYAFNGNNAKTVSFFPLHAEVRGQYFFGKDPLATTGLKPYVMASGGAAEFDAPVQEIKVIPEDQSGIACNDGTSPSPGTPCRLTGVKGYRLAGQGFVALGGGMWVLVTPNVSINVGLKALFPIPTFSFGLAPEFGIKIGL